MIRPILSVANSQRIEKEQHNWPGLDLERFIAMGTLTQLQQNRRIIQDFTSTELASISNPFARLAYMVSLRDLGSNVYEHPGLAAVYPREAVQQALEQCHEELFERILESPLPVQEEDLRSCLASMPAGLRTAASSWRKLEAYRRLLPLESPDYLKELFCSNIRTILDIIMKEAFAGSFTPHKAGQ